MRHAELLTLLLPPVSYTPSAPRLKAELEADGNTLDAAAAAAAQVELSITPYGMPELLPDWERVYDLPDKCFGVGSSWAERFEALIGRMLEIGGLSNDYLKARLAAQGYAIEIGEFMPAHCEDPCDVSLNPIGTGWQYAFEVITEDNAVRVATCEDTCTDPLAWWGNAAIECLVHRLKPSHTIPIFSYI